VRNPITTSETLHLGRPDGGDFFKSKPAQLSLEDGTIFTGFIPEWQSDSLVAEVVFNTGMTGYTETLTDPSYAGQILTFTYPLIGNYGVADESTWESTKPHLRGVVVSTLTTKWSHETGTRSLLELLATENVPVIWGIDTRALTKKLRSEGTMAGAISASTIRDFKIPTVAKISVHEPTVYNPAGATTIIAVDCGIKLGIIRELRRLGAKVIRVPHDFDYTNLPYDAIVISNGPGDPTDYPKTTAILRTAMQSAKPIFGICLGSQLMALAAGAQTYKLAYGHRGHNQPVQARDGSCAITSQNHGYAVRAETLPSDWEVTHRNLNDGSVEGIAHKTLPFSSVQFHPEASPGPTDTRYLFDNLKALIG
jgi:carbamoyl-phosphate synthase small subunit